MGVLLQAFFRPGDKGVPCPADGDLGADWWWDHLAMQAHALRQAGFTAVWLPPVWKGASGIRSVGYDPFDDYDLGSKDQRGTLPTRYGTREQLARCVAMLRANDLDVYVDLVEHHRGGGSGHEGKTFRYVDAEGRAGGGRFPKDVTCFHGPDIPQDPHVFDNQSFGAGLAPIHGQPPGYVFRGLLASADWLTRALDIQGFRLDFVKGISSDFLTALLQHGALKDTFAVGEFFDGNVALVLDWVTNPGGMRGRASAFDFPLRGFLRQMCNNAGATTGGNRLDQTKSTMAQQIAQAAIAFEQRRTGNYVHENRASTMFVESKNSQKFVYAEEYPAWNEPGQFLFILRSKKHERRYPS